MVTRKIRYHFNDADNSKTPCVAELYHVKADGFSQTLRGVGATYEEARAKVIKTAQEIPPDEDVEIEPRTEPVSKKTETAILPLSPQAGRSHR